MGPDNSIGSALKDAISHHAKTAEGKKQIADVSTLFLFC
jgi:hypothetical protein